MRVLVLVKATEYSEQDFVRSEWTEQMMAAMADYNRELRAAGILIEANGLQPSSQGVRITFRDSERVVTHGPFSRPEELVAGYWLWNVADMEEAIHWARRCPNPMPVPSDIEIRPLYDLG